LGLANQKTTFKTKIGGGLGQGSIRKKFGIPYLFLQPLKLATSNLVHNLWQFVEDQSERGPFVPASYIVQTRHLLAIAKFLVNASTEVLRLLCLVATSQQKEK